ncbi:MAG TPA: DNA/RNA non-specific endonuclease [Gaiellaceae bacterium]|nr:DNA/RNA non-specific endonuclease [Gaiellaceae bacterium]
MAVTQANEFEAAHAEQWKAAEERVAERAEARQEKIEAITSGNIAAADDPERVATRIDRLSHYYSDIRPINPTELANNESGAVQAAGAILERVINTSDFVDVRYLPGGARAARAVGRVNIRDERGRLIGYGSGSLVTPRLLLTNHHVLPDAATAASSGIEFDYEDGLDGRPLQPKLFPLDPKSFYLSEQRLDFALVAVAASASELGGFGFNRLIAAEGKAIAGDYVSIIQHPKGEKKQVALRENRIVDVLEDFLHYAADTEPGSSGSPVFNDQWEVVALHHAGVPDPKHAELGGYVNEGIRVSRLLKFIGEQNYPAEQKALADALATEEQIVLPGPQPAAATPAAAAAFSSTLRVPLEITVRLPGGNGAAAPPAPGAEAIRIDPDYTTRKGYDAEFLGSGKQAVALPALAPELVPLAAINTEATAEPRYLLSYHHFSVALNKQRRLAFFTAVNIDGALGRRLKRETDRWIFDPRLAKEEQVGEELYAHNDLDLGHLVRRLDPAWGDSEALAKLGNDDTFHFTNCSPQHKDFNRNKTSWAGLEDYILENADNLRFRVSVFSGPVLAPDDEDYRVIQLPRQFWKVVVMVKQAGTLSATGYLLSQDELLKGLEIDLEQFNYGAYRTYQVPLSTIEQLTQFSFGLNDADPLAREEAAVAAKPIERHDEIEL